MNECGNSGILGNFGVTVMENTTEAFDGQYGSNESPIDDGARNETDNRNARKPSSNDFVRKLFGLLERMEYPDIVRWTESGDSFVVLDTGKFTSKILRNHFKHSNFASFVRQLNKYDFHKVKRTQQERKNCRYGELSWEFTHPFFKIHDEQSLDNIKRKVTSAQKKLRLDNNVLLLDNNQPIKDDLATDPSFISADAAVKLVLKNSVTKDKFNQLKKKVDDLQKELSLSRMEVKEVRDELMKTNDKYYTVVESFLAYKNSKENLAHKVDTLCSALSNRGIELPKELFEREAPISPRIAVQNADAVSLGTMASNNATATGSILRKPLSSPLPSADTMIDRASAMLHHDDVDENAVLSEGFHILLVEDDDISIQLCSKFLRSYGCVVKVVTDGLAAISSLEKMKFDLVLMDIVMPNLDGATATSIIRNFDSHTPIVAMTGSVEDQDLITYLQHGMNDILAKPFTKKDLHSMLLRYLHDKVPINNQNASVKRDTTEGLLTNSKSVQSQEAARRNGMKHEGPMKKKRCT